ncbi:hypothetical protein WN51_06575 [Melipona quadrifasciata]|uniref:Uncharacterized protein n=1 Tax=Melipona quadrifasciata TaxID=166423 RepID=A0A0N0BD28_9HYME|nr:hypothetical protein WN51_06575 [Melipona quadrifasciata]
MFVAQCKHKIESEESNDEEVVSFTRRVINRISSNSDSDDKESYASEDLEEMLKEFAIAEEEELNNQEIKYSEMIILNIQIKKKLFSKKEYLIIASTLNYLVIEKKRKTWKLLVLAEIPLPTSNVYLFVLPQNEKYVELNKQNKKHLCDLLLHVESSLVWRIVLPILKRDIPLLYRKVMDFKWNSILEITKDDVATV